MLNPWLTLGTVAFCASFGVSLLMTRDLGGSLIAGCLALATGFVTAAAVNVYHNRAADSRVGALKHQIRLLQRRRSEEEQVVLEMAAEKERVALSLHSMQDELRQRQLPGFAPSRPMLSWDLSSGSAQPVSTVPMKNDRQPDLHLDRRSPDIQPELHPAALTQFIAEAAATKQKITASLNHLQTELGGLNAQVAQQRQLRDQLAQEIDHLAGQRQELTATAKNLTVEVEELERCRTDLDQYVSYVETKRQELESGTNPLQKALKQLQSQVSALQAELEQLEAQVTAKRREKADLERDSNQQQQTQPLRDSIAALESQKTRLERDLAHLGSQQEQLNALQRTIAALEPQRSQLEREISGLKSQQERVQQLQSQKQNLERDIARLKSQQEQTKSAQDALQKLDKQIADRKREKETLERQIVQLQAQKTAVRQAQTANTPQSAPQPALQSQTALHNVSQNGNSKPLPRPTRPQPLVEAPIDAPAEQLEQELSDLWTDFMVQSPEYELQALKAIAHERDSARIVSRIAEDNFTTVEELIDSINGRAEEIVGEPIIKARPGASAAIVRDHQRTIKKLIETYEYLTE